MKKRRWRWVEDIQLTKKAPAMRYAQSLRKIRGRRAGPVRVRKVMMYAVEFRVRRAG